MATKKRSFAKAFTFRVIMVIVGFIIVYAFTRSIELSLSISLVRDGVATVIYFAHERGWNKISWGMQKEKQEAAAHP